MSDYEWRINSVLDEIYEAWEGSWTELAVESGLCVATVYRIGNRETKKPQFRSVMLLADAAGFDLMIVRHKVGRRVA